MLGYFEMRNPNPSVYSPAQAVAIHCIHDQPYIKPCDTGTPVISTATTWHDISSSVVNRLKESLLIYFQVTKALRTAIMSKQYGNEDFLANLVAKACISILPEKTTFNVDNVRICKIVGSGINRSEVVQVSRRHTLYVLWDVIILKVIIIKLSED